MKAARNPPSVTGSIYSKPLEEEVEIEEYGKRSNKALAHSVPLP